MDVQIYQYFRVKFFKGLDIKWEPIVADGIGGGDEHISETGVSKEFITKEVNLDETKETTQTEDSPAKVESEESEGSTRVRKAETKVP